MARPAGRPFLDYVLSSLADAGFTRVALIVAPEGEGATRCGSITWVPRRPSRIALSFVVQTRGAGYRQRRARGRVVDRGEPFVGLNADNLYLCGYASRAAHQADGPALPVYERDQLVGRVPFHRSASRHLRCSCGRRERSRMLAWKSPERPPSKRQVRAHSSV